MTTRTNTAKEAGSGVREWREKLGLKLADMDRLTKKSHGNWAQIESGKLFPPDRAMCEDIDAGLGRDRGDTWRELARLRLLRLDPDLEEWHRASGLSKWDEILVLKVRTMGLSLARAALEREPGAARDFEHAFAERLWDLLRNMTAVEAVKGTDPHAVRTTANFFLFMEAMRTLPPERQDRLWRSFALTALDTALDLGTIKVTDADRMHASIELERAGGPAVALAIALRDVAK